MATATRQARLRQSLLAYLAIFTLLVSTSVPARAAGEAGTLAWETITSPALKGNLLGDPATRPYGIYLPPGYDGGSKRYPVVYILHGYGGNARSMAAAPAAIDEMLRSAGSPGLILVFVDGSSRYGGSFYGNSPAIGNYEEYIAHDLVQHIDAHYRTIARPESRGITGFSMGGNGALHLALLYPQVFGAVVAQAGLYDWSVASAAAYLGSVSDVKTMEDLDRARDATFMAFALAAIGAANADRPPFFLDKPFQMVGGKAQPVPDVVARITAKDGFHDVERCAPQARRLRAIKLVHGSADSMVPVSQARALDKKLTELGVKHTYEEHSGGHVFLPEKSLAFLVDHLSSTEASPATGLPAQTEQILRFVAIILSRLRFALGAQS